MTFRLSASAQVVSSQRSIPFGSPVAKRLALLLITLATATQTDAAAHDGHCDFTAGLPLSLTRKPD